MNLTGFFVSVLVFCLSYSLRAASLTITVKDMKGALVSDAVVFAKTDASKNTSAHRQTVIDQRDKQFIPYVTALQVGTSVWFSNTDGIRHHVYSFSPTKKFELPLYAGVPSEPVVFDTVGYVTLGCNIHDWMIGYVAVLPTPYFEVTAKEGRANLHNLPAGAYTVEVWHPSLKGTPDQFAQQVDLSASGGKELLFTLDLKPDFRAKRTGDLSTGGYR